MNNILSIYARYRTVSYSQKLQSLLKCYLFVYGQYQRFGKSIFHHQSCTFPVLYGRQHLKIYGILSINVFITQCQKCCQRHYGCHRVISQVAVPLLLFKATCEVKIYGKFWKMVATTFL